MPFELLFRCCPPGVAPSASGWMRVTPYGNSPKRASHCRAPTSANIPEVGPNDCGNGAAAKKL